MAQTYKFGNGTWANKEGSTLAYSDTNNAFKPLPFSFERDSIATRVNKEGLIEVVGKDIPRIDYTDSADGVLLLENSATNSLLQSNQFDTTWSATNSILSSGQIGVGGSLDAWKLESNSNSSETYIRQTTSLSGTSSLTIYAKKGSSNFLGVYIGSSGADISTHFDLNNGVVGNTSNTIETKIKSVGNGWYRCTVVGSNINQNVNFYVTDANGNFLSNDGSYIYIQYSQLESGSIPSSYIPTSGSTVQRAAETANGSGNSEVFNDSEGVLMLEISRLNKADNSSVITSINDGSLTNCIALYYNSNGVAYDIFAPSGERNGSFSMSANNQSNFNKIALKYKSQDISLFVNGFEVNTNSGTLALSGLNSLEFNHGNNAFDFYGKTKEIGYYDTALTDAELEYMTSYRSLNELVTELNLNTL